MKGTLKEIFAKGPTFDENILKAFENRKLVFFLGAGVSRIMGIKGWDDFSEFLINKAFPDFKDSSIILRDITSSKERITIAYNKFAQENKLEDFYKYFATGLTPNKKKFESTENIYKILNRFEATFLTTNADNLFEEVLGSALCHENYEVSILKNGIKARQNHLFYLHGHYTENIDPKNNKLVFTAPQYVARYNDPKFISFLKAVFHDDNTIVFIGYGLNEFELIDYIITKSNHTFNSQNKVYVLHAFCDNDDFLYENKKSYFEALNIEVIPYDISKNGYDSLIGVLNALYDYYQSHTIVPISDTISKCISKFTNENYATIKRFLSDSDLAPTTEVQITEEIQRNWNSDWVRHFFEDKLFSAQQLEIKISHRSWPLLALMADWTTSDDDYAQYAACNFLGEISTNQIENLKSRYSHIRENIARIILSLKNDFIKSDYLDMLFQMDSTLYGIGLEQPSTYKHLITWDWDYIKRLFDWLFDNIEIDSFNDSKSDMLEMFFQQFNNIIVDVNLQQNVFKYFRDLTIVATASNSYNLFTRLYDIDHIYKNDQDYWKIILTEITTTFSKLGLLLQRKNVEELLLSDNESAQKLGMYLARKFNINVSDLLLNSIFFNNSSLYHECYLLLKNQIDNGFLDIAVQDKLSDMICSANFKEQMPQYSQADESDHHQNLILSKRLAMLMALTNNRSKEIVSALQQKKIEPYPTIIMAEECDYVHIMTWENQISINQDTFNNLPYEKWVNHLNEICDKCDDIYSTYDCGQKFAKCILNLPIEHLNAVLSSFKNLSSTLISPILNELNSNREKLHLDSKVILVDFCLYTLDYMRINESIDKDLLNTVFKIIADIDIQNGESVQKTLNAIIPWLNISIDGTPAFTEEKHQLTNLINDGDFHKYETLFNCYVTRKELTGRELTDQEGLLLITLLDESDAPTYQHSLCYHYQTIKYLSKEYHCKIFEKIFSVEPFDITSLVLCTLNSRYLFEELTCCIEEKYLQGTAVLPEKCKERVLSDHFYNYIISARYANRIQVDSFERAYADYDFINHFLMSLPRWVEKEDFDTEKWLIPCWNFIKNNYEGDKLCTLACLFLRIVDDLKEHTEVLLDLFIDIATYCNEPHSIFLKPANILPFLDINATKANILIQTVLSFHLYLQTSDLEIIVCKYKEIGHSRDAATLLNMLTNKRQITIKERERLAQFLD